jgi:hypothetical protein
MSQKQAVDTILKTLAKQHFANWYEQRFIPYLEGGENAPTKEDIRKDIANIFQMSKT